MDADSIEQMKLALEQRKVEIEERREHRENLSRWFVRIGVGIPLVAAVITAIISTHLQARSELKLEKLKAKNEFETRAAEIVMATDSPSETHGRARALAALFPEQLGDNFAAQFKPDNYSNRDEFLRDQRIMAKKEFLNLFTRHAEHRAELIRLWRQLFPGDEWVDDVSE